MTITMIKRIAIRISLVPVFLFLAACATVTESTVDKTTGLTFIHLNDTYRVGAVEDGKRGGFGRVVTVMRKLQKQGRDVRILHAGDFLYPSLESQLWNGLQMVDAMNFMDALAPMYVTVGNHEFDRRTPEHLVDAVRESQFDWLGDNFQFRTAAEDVDSALRSAFTFESNGKKIGIFSLTLHVDDGGNERDYVPIDKNYYAIAKRVIEQFEQSGVDAIVGLTHLHVYQDREIAQLRKAHPKFVFIVGGHDHEPQFSAFSDTSAAVMKGASNARVIWQIDMRFDAAGLPQIEGHMLNMDQSVAIDPEYAQLQQKWRDKLLHIFPFLEARVGEAAFPLDATEVTTRSRETAWGNFIVDQMLAAFGEPRADLAFINSGSLRIDDYIMDDIRFEDIGRTFGFSSFLRSLTVTGEEFVVAMETGFRGKGQGYFPQIAGFRVCVNYSREPGSRIVSLQVPSPAGWQVIEPQREYTLVVPDFIYGGGDGYVLPQDRDASRPGSELKYLLLDAIIRAQATGEKIGVTVDAANPRIEVHDRADAQCFSGNSADD